jgi:hypothetical protein
MTSPRYKLLVAILEREGISTGVSDVIADEIWELLQTDCHCRELPYTRRQDTEPDDELSKALARINAQLDVLLAVTRGGRDYR